MVKVHTRVKRAKGLGTHLNAYRSLHPGVKKNRPRTFKTEEKAINWAETNKLSKSEYHLKSVKKNKKFQVVKTKV